MGVWGLERRVRERFEAWVWRAIRVVGVCGGIGVVRRWRWMF